jgi:TPR repeat protein
MLRMLLPVLAVGAFATTAVAQTSENLPPPVIVPVKAPALPATFADLKAQAKAGNINAQFAMGRAHLDGWYGGKAVSRSVEEARKWFAMAAEAGNAEAAYEMAMTYYPAEIEEAEKWFLKSALGGRAAPHYRLCDIYRTSALKDWDKALVWCRKAAEKGLTEPYAAMAAAVETGQDGQTASPSRAMEMYVELAQWRDGPATLRLAEMYHALPVGPENDANALRYTRMAIGFDPKIYLTRLAHYYETGRGVAADPGEAGRLYWHAGRLGAPEAMAWVSAHPDLTQAGVDAQVVPAEQFAGQPLRYKGARRVDNAAFYPERAADDEVDGSTTVECRIIAAGDVENCVSSQETPLGYGFAIATTRLITQADLHVSDPALLKPYAGKLVRFRFVWQLG